MMKITTDDVSPDHRVFRLEGRIGGSWIAELKNLCEQALRNDRSLTLDLSGVTFVERGGAKLLRSLEKMQRVAVVGSTAFVAEQLDSEDEAF